MTHMEGKTPICLLVIRMGRAFSPTPVRGVPDVSRGRPARASLPRGRLSSHAVDRLGPKEKPAIRSSDPLGTGRQAKKQSDLAERIVSPGAKLGTALPPGGRDPSQRPHEGIWICAHRHHLGQGETPGETDACICGSVRRLRQSGAAGARPAFPHRTA
jgi:hypothetical protein